MINCNDSGEDQTLDSNELLMTDVRSSVKNSHNSSNFQTPEKKISRNSSKKSEKSRKL